MAIAGLDACRKHAGQATAAAVAKGQANIARVRFRDVGPGEYVDPGDVLLWAVTLAQIDLADYRLELREMVADPAHAGPSDAELDRVSRLQFDAARMAKMALDAGIAERQVRLAERTAEQLVAVLRGVVTELGHDASDPTVAGVVRKHLALVAGSPG